MKIMCQHCNEKIDRNYTFCPYCGNHPMDIEKLKEFSHRIKHLREKAGESQEHIAKVVGMRRQTISLYEKGESEPNICTLKKLCEHFDVTADYLIGLQDSECTMLVNFRNDDE